MVCLNYIGSVPYIIALVNLLFRANALTSDKLNDSLACRLYLITCRLYLAAGGFSSLPSELQKNKKQIQKRATEAALNCRDI